MTSNLERLPVFAVASAENAMSLVGGEQTASMTSAQIYQNIKSRAESADALQMSDFYMVTDSGTASTSTVPATCDFIGNCTFWDMKFSGD